MSNQTVYCIIPTRAKLEKIVQELHNSGISNRNISFLSSNYNAEFPEFSGDSSKTTSNRNWRTEERDTTFPSQSTQYTQGSYSNQGKLGTEKHSKAPEGATAGATTGGIIGGVLGLLAGIGALAIPGFGPFVAAGPILATLGGIGAGGTIGGVIGALVGAGIPEYEAKHYENRLKEGGILLSVSVNSDEEAKKVKKILQSNGAEDVNVSSETTATKNGTKKK